MDASKKTYTPDGDEGIYTLLVTANVGSLFEDPLRLLRPWLVAFLEKVGEFNPKFLALHLQEVGGKTYEKSMECVQEFISQLCEAPEMQEYELIRIFMDEDFNSAEHFTALGNLYFIHKHLKNVRFWNFLTRTWEKAEGKDIYSGNIETIASKEKSKFPQHFFPECKWSRKGFMRTRWEVNNTVFDLVNIHLFHDASNLAACEEFPSIYCRTRRRALVHTLERFHLDEKNGLVPFFVFGDFNFRCDAEGVVKELTENLTAHRVQSMKSDNTKVHYRNSAGDNVLTVGKKEFNHADHQLKFKESWLKKFDRELDPLRDFLHEFIIEFPPSYPYEEDPEMPTDYMSTRCPSWCDRILMSPQAQLILDENISPNLYNLIGENVCMGDHKPVYLYICIKPNQGTYRCCNCHYLKSNTESTHNIPAVTIDTYKFADINCVDTGYCQHGNKMCTEFIFECKQLNNELKDSLAKSAVKFGTTSAEVVPNLIGPLHDVHSDIERSNIDNTTQFRLKVGGDGTYNNESNHEVTTWPQISINLIDTDDMHVCMCSQISNAINISNKSINSSICPLCQNIIKNQSVEPRYRLISKRLMLPNNIIVNRIDTQHLSTYFDFSHKHQDPYTPESAESHSPCPELNSSSTTTSSNCCISAADGGRLLESECYVLNSQKLAVVTYGNDFDGENIIPDENGEQQRGVVSPHQLKTRLEDLQSSKQNSKFLNSGDGDVAGDSDVEHIDVFCLSSKTPVDRYPNSCLHKCCNIQ